MEADVPQGIVRQTWTDSAKVCGYRKLRDDLFDHAREHLDALMNGSCLAPTPQR